METKGVNKTAHWSVQRTGRTARLRRLLLMASATLAFGAASMGGCSDLGRVVPEDLFAELVTVPRSPISRSCSVFILEHITTQGNALYLHVQTLSSYSPGGYTIAGKIARSGNVFALTLENIQPPAASNQSPAPAQGVFELGNLPPGFYPIAISMNGALIHALLILDAEAYTTTLQKNTMLTAPYPQLRRIPPETIWGYLDYPSFEDHYIVGWSFLDSLVYLGARHHGLKDGEYWYFRISGAGRAELALPHLQQYYDRFLYRFDVDTSVSRGLVKRYAKRYPDSVDIRLYGGRGEEFLSDVLRLEP